MAAVLALWLLVLAACGGSPGGRSEPSGRPSADEGGAGSTAAELVAAVAWEIEGTDIQQISLEVDLVHGLLSAAPISLGLQNDQVLPHSVQDVQISPDGREIRLILDPERRFHNGVPVTAAAYQRSVERYRETSPYAFDWDPVTEVIAEDERTVLLRLETSSPGLLVVLGSMYGAPVEVGAAEELGDEAFNRAVVSDGPYLVEEWVDGSHITLVRNDDYRSHLSFVENNGPFSFERVTVRFIPEDFTRVNELRAGNVHLITDVPVEQVPALESDPNIDVYAYTVPNVRYLHLHSGRPPLDDRLVRLAIARALDRDEMAVGAAGAITPNFGVVGRAMISFDEETEGALAREFAPNLEEARRLLAEAGWTDDDGDGVVERGGAPLRLTLMIPSDSPVDKRVAPIIQQQLQRVGIEVQLREYDRRYLRQSVEDGDFELALQNWDWLDPGGVWPATLQTGGRFAKWTDPELDRLVDEAVAEPVPEERARRWGDVSRKVWEEVPVIPLWSDRRFIAARSNLQGLHISVSGTIYLNDARWTGE